MYTTLSSYIPTTTIMEVSKEIFQYLLKIIFTWGTRCQAMNLKKKKKHQPKSCHLPYNTLALLNKQNPKNL